MIAAALAALAGNPRAAACVKLARPKTSGASAVREYRLIYQIKDTEQIVTVVKIGDRRYVYR